MKKLFILLPFLLTIQIFGQAGSINFPPFRQVGNQVQFYNPVTGVWTKLDSASISGGWSDLGNTVEVTTSTDTVKATYIRARNGLIDFQNSVVQMTWSPPKGGLILDGTDDKIIISSNDNFSPHTTDYTWIFDVIFDDVSISQGIASRHIDGANSLSVGYNNTSSRLELFAFSNYATNGYWAYITCPFTPVANTKYKLQFSVSQTNSTGYIYINNVLQSLDVNTVNNYDYSLAQQMELGLNNTADYLKGKFLNATFWNLVPDQTLRDYLFNNGNPNGSVIPYKYRGASQTALTSGTLTIGLEYTIDTYVTGDDFTNVGAASNASGVVFTATGTTPTTWTNSSSLRHTGNVLELKGINMGANGGVETSGNGLHFNTSGNPIARAGLRDARTDVSTSNKEFVNSQKAETILKKVLVNCDATGTISVGTTAGGTDFVNAASVTANTWATFHITASTAYTATERSVWAVTSTGTATVILIYEEL